MKKLLILLAISAQSIASVQPTADIMFTEMVALRSISPSAFEAAFEYNRFRLLKCGDVKSISDFGKTTEFQDLLKYFTENKSHRNDNFNSLFEGLESKIECEQVIVEGSTVPFNTEKVKVALANLEMQVVSSPDNKSVVSNYLQLKKLVSNYSKLFSQGLDTTGVENKMINLIENIPTDDG